MAIYWEQEAHTYAKLNLEARKKILEHFRPEDQDENDLHKFLTEEHSPHHLAVRLNRYHKKMEKEWKSALQKAREEEARWGSREVDPRRQTGPEVSQAA